MWFQIKDWLVEKKSKNMNVDIHRLTDNPSAAYEDLVASGKKFIKLKVKQPINPVSNEKVRVVCMSDTHSLTSHMKFDIPDGDIFIHAGDFTKCGLLQEVKVFNNWLGRLPHKHKIVIAGNHELTFDPAFTHPFQKQSQSIEDIPMSANVRDLPAGVSRSPSGCAPSDTSIKKELTDCIYLEDSMIEIYGLKIYGSPWQPRYCNWAFNLPRGRACLDKWDLIPDKVDILITHSPPLGHGDLACSGVRAGCVELLTTVQQRIKPKYHIFGHIHEGYGVSTDGKTIYINASTCNINYIPNNEPVVFDITLPPGQNKSL